MVKKKLKFWKRLLHNKMKSRSHGSGAVYDFSIGK